MHYSWKQFLVFVLFLTAGSLGAICTFKSKNVVPTKAMYFWESGRETLTPKELNFLTSHQTQKMYVKFFEIEKNNTNAVPISKSLLNLKGSELNEMEIVPTVYIQNEVFKSYSEREIEELAENVYYLITKKFKEQFSDDETTLKEIQMDCDWTISTRENYFAFLKKLKEKGNFVLSATLRLYPYKFPDQMGVLPVDRAMLMCYNLISPMDAGTRNSILDLPELEKYLVGAKKYPIPLDLALPIYSAALIVQNNRFVGIHYFDIESLKKHLQVDKEPWYYSKMDTVLNNFYLRKGDKVKLESISASRIQEALKIIRKNVTFKQGMTLSLFHLQDNQIQQFNYEEVSRFYSIVSPR